jgi:hypothetical protein
MFGKLIASLFLILIMLVPVAIVLTWHRIGAIWVAGYVFGIATIPFVAIGALRSASEMFEENKAMIAFAVYGCAVVVISLVAAALGFIQ